MYINISNLLYYLDDVNRVSDFHDFLRFLFPKEILFDFYSTDRMYYD